MADTNLTRSLLLDMEPDLLDGVRMARAAMMLAQEGTVHDLEREEIAALEVVVRVVHTRVQALQERWQAAVNVAP